MKNVLFIFGTRPEVIKLAPVIIEMKKYPENFNVIICNTEQQKELSNQTLNYFGLKADYNLDCMRENQTLSDVQIRIMNSLNKIFTNNRTDISVIQGDTITVLSGALTSFYNKIPIAHIEAGLRSYNLFEPYPEEAIRQMTSRIAALNFAPNERNKSALLNENMHLKSNIFNESNICELGISFIYNEKNYSYEFKYDDLKLEFLYEKLSEIYYEQSGKEAETIIFEKDTINKVYQCDKDEKLKDALEIISKDNLIIYTLASDNFIMLKDIKQILVATAKNIEIVDMNNIPNKKTIDLLKLNDERTKKVVEFIKNADLYLENYKYEENPKLDIEMDSEQIDEKTLKNQNIVEQAKLVSVYKGKAVSSIQFDSVGTRKFASLASYIIESLEEGKTLFVDELDSSLHFKITRAIISMFNSNINKNAQLIATLHDVSLLDCKRLFRKEQIWFTDKDENGTDLYSLKEFSYAESGVRDTTDVQDRYSKGAFGAIPDPDLISTLLEVKDIEED